MTGCYNDKEESNILGVAVEETAIAKKLLELDEKIVVLDGKIDRSHQELLQGHDEITVILRRLDQERIFTTEWIKRVDKRVEKLEKKC